MSIVRFQPLAAQDLDDIALFIARDSLEAALEFTNLIEERCHTLAQFPLMGRSRPELGSELRSFPVGRYIIFYRPIENGIEVVRVLNAARDISTLF